MLLVQVTWKIFHDSFVTNGGAERFLYHLSKALDIRDIITLAYCPKMISLRVQSFSGLKSSSLFLGILGAALSTHKYNAADVVIYSGMWSPFFVRKQKLGKKIFYCHSPPDFIGSYRNTYKSWIKSFTLRLLGVLLRTRYVDSIKAMDIVIANSAYTELRLRGLGIEVDQVFYPNVDEPPATIPAIPGKYYLSTARHEKYKRVDKVIDAFLLMPEKNLVVLSAGSQTSRLRRRARNAENIRFLDYVDRETWERVTDHCICSIYVPFREDFGMSVVESLARGKPVLGSKSGGVGETIIPESTGLLLPECFGIDDLVAAVEKMTDSWCLSIADECVAQSQRFSPSVSLTSFKDLVESTFSDCEFGKHQSIA